MKIKHRLFSLAVAPVFIAIILSAVNASLMVSNNKIVNKYVGLIDQKEGLILGIYAALGYGKGIHAFKNLVLRGDSSYYEVAKSSFALVQKKTSEYLEIEEISEFEKRSMLQVRQVVNRYSLAADQAKSAISHDKSPVEIDSIVRIDDQPALDAFEEIRSILSKERTKSIDSLVSSQRHSFLIMGFFLLAILVLSAGMARTLVTHIIRSLNLLESITSSVSRGDYRLNDLILRSGSHSQDELGDLLKAVDSMCKSLDRSFHQLEKANNSLEEFAYVASHDMKSPLRGISNIASWIQQDCALDENGSEHISKIKFKIKRMEDILDDLLEYSRIGRASVRVELVDSHELVTKICDSLDKPKEYQTIVDGKLPKILTQKSPFDLVMRNLIDNAIKYRSCDSGWVKISAIEEKHFHVFKVEDNGKGIPKDLHEKAFAIFQTLQAKSQSEGTGIGLAIVKKAVHEHGGKILLDSDDGQGATFFVSWPKEPIEDDHGFNN